jgi:hypothetical protein
MGHFLFTGDIARFGIQIVSDQKTLITEQGYDKNFLGQP